MPIAPSVPSIPAFPSVLLIPACWQWIQLMVSIAIRVGKPKLLIAVWSGSSSIVRWTSPQLSLPELMTILMTILITSHPSVLPSPLHPLVLRKFLLLSLSLLLEVLMLCYLQKQVGYLRIQSQACGDSLTTQIDVSTHQVLLFQLGSFI